MAISIGTTCSSYSTIWIMLYHLLWNMLLLLLLLLVICMIESICVSQRRFLTINCQVRWSVFSSTIHIIIATSFVVHIRIFRYCTLILSIRRVLIILMIRIPWSMSQLIGIKIWIVIHTVLILIIIVLLLDTICVYV